MKLNKQTLGMLAALAAIFALFAVLTGGTFLSPRNLSLMSRQMAVTGMLASGMVLVIVAGQIDLSVGAMAGFCGAVAAMLATSLGLPLPLVILASAALGAALGLGQGALVAKFKIPPFIVTLGGMLLFQGALLGLTRGVSVIPPPNFLALGQAFLSPGPSWILGAIVAVLLIWKKRPVLGALSLGLAALYNGYEGVPWPVVYMLMLTALYWAVAAHTPAGRHLYAIGGNREAAFYAGIPIEKRIMGVFALMGATAGLAGIVFTARVGAATSDAGRMMELDAIAAAVIGGTSLLGGRGSVWGALLGACVMASLDNGLSLLNTEAFWQPVIKGAILVAAVGVDLRMRGGKS